MSSPTPLRLVSKPALDSADSAVADAVRFGHFELQLRERQLLAAGQPTPLRARALDLLIVLVQRAGQLVSRAELLDLVWPGLVVEENNLSVQMNALRKVLGSDIVATVPGRGYRFMASTAATAAKPVVLAAVPDASLALRTNLPAVLPPLIGRDAELAELGTLVEQHRLVTMLGIAGIGKTCLAQALLATHRTRHAQGVCFVDLSTQTDGAALAITVASALGMPQPSGNDPQAALVQALAPMQMLVVLDNAEQLVDAVASLAAALMAGAPGLHLLVTSQVPLRVAQEWQFRLGALTIPEDGADVPTASACGAVALFTRRAQAQAGHFTLTPANVAQVIELCRQLDGSPLAIELAAARVPLLGLPALLRGLSQQLRLLTTGQRDAPQRHQTLRAALDWSLSLLSDNEQAAFRRLGIFVGSASLPAVLAVLADDEPGGLDEWAALDALGALVDRALVEMLPTEPGRDDPPRYRLLVTPRAYAREQLQRSLELPAVERRHALAMRAFYADARDALYSGRQRYSDWKVSLDPDVENGLAAVAWALRCDPSVALEIAPVISRNIWGRRHPDCKALWQAVEPALDAALSAMDSEPPPVALQVLARACAECGGFWTNTRAAHTMLRCRQAVALSRRIGDRVTEFIALGHLGWCLGSSGDLPALRVLVAERAALQNPMWAPFIEASTCEHENWLFDDPNDEVACLARQAAKVRAAGLGDGTQMANMVNALVAAGRIEEAIAHARELVARAVGQRHVGTLRHNLNNLCRAYLALDQTLPARDTLREFWPLAVRHDMQGRWADVAALLAAIEHRPHCAMALLGHADAWFAHAGAHRQAREQQMIERAVRLIAQSLGRPVSGDLRQASVGSLPGEELSRLAFASQDILIA